MKRILLPTTLITAFLIAGCAPTITANNNTTIPVRVVVLSNGTRQVLSPSPGESSTAEVSEGAWTATVIPDTEWRSYAQDVRRYLLERLKNPKDLTGEQILETVRRLKEIANQLKQFEEAAKQISGQSCSGRISDEEGAGLVDITTNEDGALVMSCR